MDVDSHKLCGFLRAVLAVSSSSSAPESLVPGTALCFAGDASFRSADGRFLLRPLPDLNAAPSVGAAASPRVSTAGKGPGADPGPAAASNSLSSSSRKRRRRRGGAAMVNGSISVVQHLHELVKHRCLKIEARVVGVSGFRAGGRGAAPRAVVLVDVYLPVAAWSDWQFPKCRALVASVFKHVSCDWEVRNSLLALDWMSGNYPNDDASVWDCCDCHVLGCRLHCSTSVSGKNKLFDLHEIFKSLPSIAKEMKMPSTRIKPLDESFNPGIWDIADDVLTNVLSQLGPKDLVRVAGTCNHLRHLTASIIPCMKLKLFPHQEAAVEWMLKREQSCEILKHPMYMEFMTEDGFPLYINSVSGDISTGMAPNINDFRGGMFCDEPGLGKTVTSLSLILKTHGTFADPPHGVEVIWCMNNMDQKCGYYEVNAVNSSSSNFMSSRKRFVGVDGRQGWLSEKTEISSCTSSSPVPITCVLRHTRTRSSSARRNILCAYGDPLFCDKRKAGENIISKTYKNEEQLYPGEDVHDNKKLKKDTDDVPDNKKLKKDTDVSETWVQCDACRKWRKISDRIALDSAAAWFCSMNNDPLHQNCRDPEESWDYKTKITYLPGFYTKGTRDGLEQNISFFTSVLKEHFWVFDSETKKALNWLAKLSHRKLQEMEKNGCPVLGALDLNLDSNGYHKIFQAFGLVCRNDRSVSRWYYPSNLDNLEFDSTALKIALTKPLDIQRFYLSRATLIVVPTNLIDHWKTQIQKHVSPGQLRVYVWADQKKPCAHTLAWDYDIVITTFSRLSAEWGPRKRSVLMQVHWLRVMLDEGHTLGSSLNLTNRLQMAISLHASYRWILTGTPTPNTPNSQVSHLQSMLKFLHEEAYGQNQESWESGILRPFEAQMEEGRLRLIQLLQRSMISSRKVDIKNIPPCIKKITYVEFTEEHARSYNELVVTARRNILMADWNDPSHVESLLNPKQWKYRSNTIRNVRLSCCVAGHVKVADAGQDIQETMDILVQLGLDPLSEEYLFIKGSLVAGCRCFRCKDWCRLPIITPCRHLLCIDCIQLDSEKCTMHGCGNFYEMQSPETLARPENPNPKWPVPKDLIELQPSYKQDDWDPDWQSTSSSKVAYVVEKLKDLRELNRKIGHGHDKVYDSNVPLYSDKSLTSLSHLGGVKQDTELCTTSVDKVIIFSQFLEHIHVIEQQLAIAGITYIGMYSPMPSSNKMDSLMVFQQDPNCMVLLMDGSAALGLDLSFVTYVFLMEPIWDRSMEEQVISRAHRMGATRPINVETLAMRGTIEEQMLDFLQAGNACQSTLTQEINRDNYEGTRAPRSLHDFAESNYLAHLSFVRKKL